MSKSFSSVATLNQLTAGGFIATFFLFQTVTRQPIPMISACLWMLAGPLIYLVNDLFLARERTVQQLAAVDIVCGVALFAAMLLLNPWYGVTFAVLEAVACVILCARGIFCATKTLTLARTIQWMDISLIVLVLFVAYLGALDLSLIWAAPSLIGCGGAVFALISYRSGESLGVSGWGFFIGTILALCGVIAALVQWVSTGAGQGVRSLWAGLIAALHTVGVWITRFMEWFTSLFPEEKVEALELESETTAVTVVDTSTQLDFSIPIYVFIAAGILLAVAIVLLFLWLSKIKAGGRKMPMQRKTTLQRKRASVWRVLLMRLQWLREGIRIRLYLHRHRNTAIGLYYTLLRETHRRTWRQGSAHTPSEYLTLLSARAQEETLSAALLGLIEPVEKALYAPNAKNERYANAAVIRKSVRSFGKNRT